MMRIYCATMTLALVAALAFAENVDEPDKPPCKLGFCMGEKVPHGTVREHALFDGGVMVNSQPTTGVCKVVGVLNVANPDDFGDAHKAAYKRIVELVEGKYGPATNEFDTIRYGSLWENGPRYWLMGLKSGDRDLMSFWFSEQGANLPKGIGAIGVTTNPKSITLGYEFTNIDDCTEEKKRHESSDL